MKLRLKLVETAIVVQAKLKKMSALGSLTKKGKFCFLSSIWNSSKLVCQFTCFHHNYFFQLDSLHIHPISETAGHAYKVVKSRPIVTQVYNQKNTKNKYKNKLHHIPLANSGKTWNLSITKPKVVFVSEKEDSSQLNIGIWG